MTQRQVTAAEYDECVREGGCPASPQDENAISGNLPVVKVNWRDASAYAIWLSRRNGRSYRLPTDEEWAFAAGSRFADDSFGVDDSPDPSKRWLARYEMESNRDNFDKDVMVLFDVNEYGLADLAGNVGNGRTRSTGALPWTSVWQAAAPRRIAACACWPAVTARI